QGFGREETEQVDRTVDYAGLEKATNVKPGDVRSDIYFLGCVLYEALTGRTPLVTTKDKHQRMQRERFEKVPPIAAGEIKAPPSVHRLVHTMMSLNPRLRYQTPTQLLEAIRATRRDLEHNAGNGQVTERSVFVVESDSRLQDGIRGKLKEHGFRVYIASDPNMALTRYRQQPYSAIIVDTGSVGEEGLHIFDRVLSEAGRLQLDCAGILVLAEDQADWAQRIRANPRVAVMVRPGITFKRLHHKLEELVPAVG
ncbi:MAG TPA: serine/threonine protein kinase, partial [Gemmataceae bacterium]|nr:serine/threonine protein kinase [Gemmataceae bacterium]